MRLVSARALSDTSRKHLTQRLQRRVRTTIEVEYSVDPALIAGMRLFVEGTMIDGSTAGALGRLRESLLASDASASRTSF